MPLEIIIGTENDTSEDSIDTLCRNVSGWVLQRDESTYDDAKREDVSRFVEFALEMCLWTAPVVVASQHSFDAPPFGEISRILKVGDLDLFNYCVLAITARVGHNSWP